MSKDYDHDLSVDDVVVDTKLEVEYVVDDVNEQNGTVVWVEGWEESAESVDANLERGDYVVQN